MRLTKKELNKIAREQGFVRDTLEKVYRLEDILVFINSHPLMKKRLALKGGTAINLTVFNLPRLSVDIDLDYSMRNHVLPLVHREIVDNGILEKNSVLAVAGIELFGSKIKALLDRAAARDLYDVSNMVKFGLFDSSEQGLLRKCTLFSQSLI